MREIIGYDGNAARVGDRVELHPATDLWMMGARCGVVTSISKDGQSARVRIDIDGRSYFVHARNLRAA